MNKRYQVTVENGRSIDPKAKRQQPVGVLIDSFNNRLVFDWWHLTDDSDPAWLETGLLIVDYSNSNAAYTLNTEVIIEFDTIEQFNNWFSEKYFIYVL